MSARKKFIGLDVHQETLATAVADDGVDREVRYFGTIANRPEALHAALKTIGQDGAELRVGSFANLSARKADVSSWL